MLRGLAALDDLSRTEVVARTLFYRHGFSSCYVGRNDRGDIVSMQWLIRPADNTLLEKYLHRRRRLLNDSEVMIENIFIFPEFRRLGFFPSINHKLITVAQQEGFQACSAYVSKDNIASLNSYVGLGFRIENLMTGYNVAGQFWGLEDPR
jgi:ribosomal protein S18 acetylase RimI-like enzyme